MKILSKFVCKISTRLVKSYFQIIEVLLLLPLYCISLHTQSDFLNHRSILTLNLKFYFHENKTCSMKKKKSKNSLSSVKVVLLFIACPAQNRYKHRL